MKFRHFNRLFVRAILVAGMVLMSTGAMAKPKDTVKSLTQEAATAFSKKHYEEARDLFLKAYDLDKTDDAEGKITSSLYYNLGRVYEALGDVDLALDNYKTFVTIPSITTTHEKSVEDALKRIKQLQEIKSFKDELAGDTPKKGASPAAGKSANPPAKKTCKKEFSGACVDINAADVSDLTRLCDVGDSTAKKIIESRTQEGPFKSLEDVTRIKGIGQSFVDKNLDRVCPMGSGGQGAVKMAPVAKKDDGKKAKPDKPLDPKAVKPAPTQPEPGLIMDL